MKKKKNTRKILIIIFFLLFVLFIFYLFLPAKAYVEMPGKATDVRRVMKVGKKRDKTRGNLRFVSVYLFPARNIDYIKRFFNHTISIETKKSVQGNYNSRIYKVLSELQMKNSILSAEKVAFNAANKSSQIKTYYQGIYVLDVNKNSNFFNKIKIGDVITKINHHHFNRASGYQNYLAYMPVGKKIILTVLRKNKKINFSGKVVHLPKTKNDSYPQGRNGIGVSLINDVNFKTKPKIRMNTKKISGPSGGLMFSLQLYSQLTGQNIKKSRNISGTGTINKKGKVGEVGGISKKLIAAQKAKSKVFLVPYVKATSQHLKTDGGKTNWQEAKETKKKFSLKIKLVPISSFSEALDSLKKY